MTSVALTPSQRFWAYVEPQDNGCLLWTGTVTWKGYGRFNESTGRRVYAHRWAYESEVGPIPAGLFIDHLCRVRNCVNPKHMEPVTIRENILRGDASPPPRLKTATCPVGHSYDGLRYYERGNPSRVCRTCQRERDSRRNYRLERALRKLRSQGQPEREEG